MQERIDQELERMARRRGLEIFQPPVIKSLLDIKRVLSDLDPSRYVSATDTTLQTELESIDEHGRARTYRVSATTKPQTKRSILLEGFNIIKARQQLRVKAESNVIPTVINGRTVRPALRLQVDSYLWVEPLLERWLSAYRDGLWICWNVRNPDGSGYVYRYDIFQHRLMRAPHEDGSAAVGPLPAAAPI